MNRSRGGMPRRRSGLCLRSAFRWARHGTAILLLGLLPGPNLAGAGAPTDTSEKRVLLIIETSDAMKKRAPAVEQTLRELVLTGFNQALSRGDTIGLWTFNDWLGAGEFPLQRWSPETASLTAGLVTDFVKSRRYSGPARPETVWPELNRLIQSSETLLVCWFTSGERPLQGTPFDREINAVYREHQRALRRSQLAFVTLLYARGGAIINYSQNSTGGPILVPTTPAPGFTDPVAARPRPEPPPPAPVASTSAPPAKPVAKAPAPLIVEKGVIKSAPWTHEPPRGFTNLIEPGAVAPRSTPAPTPAPTQPVVAPAPPPAPQPPPAAAPVSAPASPPASTTPDPAPALSTAATRSAPRVAPSEPTLPATPPPAQPAASPPAPAPSPTTPPVPRTGPTPEEPEHPASPSVSPAEWSRTAPPSPAESPPKAPPPTSPPAVATRPAPAPPAAEVATVTSTVSVFGAWLTVALLVLCVLLAGICIGLLLARRRFERASLITEAFERERHSDRGPSAR